MHYYQFHVGDYLSHTSRLSNDEDLCYRRLLDLYYQTESPISLDIERVARLIGFRDQIKVVSDVLSDFFLKSEQGYRNKRCDEVIDAYHAKSDRAKNANKARWKSEEDLKLDLKSDTDQIPTNNHKPITNNQKPIEKKKATIVACPPDVNEQVWSDWVQLRKGKKATVTETVVNMARKEAAKAGKSLEEFLAIWCARGSQGLEASWLEDKNQSKPNAGDRNREVMSGLTRGLIGGRNDVGLLGK